MRCRTTFQGIRWVCTVPSVSDGTPLRCSPCKSDAQGCVWKSEEEEAAEAAKAKKAVKAVSEGSSAIPGKILVRGSTGARSSLKAVETSANRPKTRAQSGTSGSEPIFVKSTAPKRVYSIVESEDGETSDSTAKRSRKDGKLLFLFALFLFIDFFLDEPSITITRPKPTTPTASSSKAHLPARLRNTTVEVNPPPVPGRLSIAEKVRRETVQKYEFELGMARAEGRQVESRIKFYESELRRLRREGDDAGKA